LPKFIFIQYSDDNTSSIRASHYNKNVQVLLKMFINCFIDKDISTTVGHVTAYHSYIRSV